MKNIFLIAGAVAMAVGMPAVAQGQGKGKGAAAKPQQSLSIKRNAKSNKQVRTNVRAQNKYGGNVCPPGLVKKTPTCVPPGQVNRSFREGQRVGKGYRYYTPYGNIPEALRNQYNLDDDNRYIYRDNTIYQVDPATSVVTRIINTIL
ncbi:MAG TPA: hypothetical protein VFK79_02395 [Xanthobacteraceae bacterium]|nr:hypothetical protein [Xanthobacteraceae bacterium]